jgi:lactate dehydrogenase-like 2-hydroxyacid dehydrogenase
VSDRRIAHASAAAETGTAMTASACATDTLVKPAVNGLGLNDGLAEALEARFRLHRLPESFDPKAEVLAVLGTRVDEALVGRLPALRLVAVLGAGYDNVDTAVLRRRGIALANTPGLTDACVADLAMGLLVAARRGIVAADRYVRAGGWSKGRFPLMPRFAGGHLGIYGLGRIGAAIARRAAGFDLDIAYHNRHPRAGIEFRYFDDLEALARWSDYLVVACPATPETHHRVDARVLRALGPQGILVNIARGAIVDEAALVDALETGVIAGAGLDVFEREPVVTARLLVMDNVVLTPHIGGGSNETWDACYAGVVDNIESYFRTGRAATPVDLAAD